LSKDKDSTNRPFRCAALITAVAVGVTLSGCTTAVVGSITLGQISTAAGVASVGTTGKGLQDHALSAVTGQDCRLLEGIVRTSRRICEEPGSAATENDFRGFLAILRGNEETATISETEAWLLYVEVRGSATPSLTRTFDRRRHLGDGLAQLDVAVGDLPSVSDWARAQTLETQPADAAITYSNSSVN